MDEYDVIVLGGGAAGLTSSSRAARYGAKTLLVEKNLIGGECTHSGCVPSKALINIAKHVYDRRFLSGMVDDKSVGKKVDFPRVMDHVKGVVEHIYDGEKPDRIRENGIDVTIGKASFTSTSSINVNNEMITFKKAAICTGSSPLIFPIEGLDSIKYLTNENIFKLENLPESLLIVGGGPISVELGQAFSRLGSKVTIVELMEWITLTEDDEVSRFLTGILEAEGIKVLTGSKIVKFNRVEGRVETVVETPTGKQEITSEKILVSTGRVPNISDLNLEAAEVEYTKQGVSVDEHLASSNNNIYAAGDCVGPVRLSHVAGYQGGIAVENMLNNAGIKNELSALPWAIFTDPEVGHVGMTEAQASENHKGVHSFKAEANGDRFVTDGKDVGFIKIVLDKDDNILGANACCAHAGEIIHEFTLAMKHGLKPSDIDGTIHAYPTYSELAKSVCHQYLKTKG